MAWAADGPCCGSGASRSLLSALRERNRQEGGYRELIAAHCASTTSAQQIMVKLSATQRCGPFPTEPLALNRMGGGYCELIIPRTASSARRSVEGPSPIEGLFAFIGWRDATVRAPPPHRGPPRHRALPSTGGWGAAASLFAASGAERDAAVRAPPPMRALPITERRRAWMGGESSRAYSLWALPPFPPL